MSAETPLSFQACPHREAIVAALTSYYDLLTQFPYLSVEKVQHAPPNGWDLKTAADLYSAGVKSAAVVDVLNHIPYLIATKLEVNYETWAIDWRSDNVRQAFDPNERRERMDWLKKLPLLQQSNLEPMFQTLPSSVISLTRGSNYGRWLLLDVDTGLVVDYSLLGGPSNKCTDEENQAGLGWTKFEAKPVTEFFDDWCEKLRSLSWCPIPGDDGESGAILSSSHAVGYVDQEEVRNIYRNHGWDDRGVGQGCGFRKEQCRVAVCEWHSECSRKVLAQYTTRRAKRKRDRRARAITTLV